MKKIIITRKLLKESEEKASKTFDVKLNSNDELYSQSKLIELSEGHDAILTSLTDKMDEETINKLPDSIKIISNFAVGFGPPVYQSNTSIVCKIGVFVPLEI